MFESLSPAHGLYIPAILLLGLVVGYLVDQIPWRIFVMVIAPLLQLALFRHALQREITTAFCTGLTWLGAALLLGYNLWVVLGLPGVTA